MASADVDVAPDLSNSLSDDDDFPEQLGPADDEEQATLGGADEEEVLDDDADLFGDDDDGDEKPGQRKLDDEELDSGDDEGRTDRAAAAEETHEEQTFNYMDADIARHPVPEPSDGELYLLKVPRFLSFEPTAFNHKTFQAPTTDHHSKAPPSDHFSAFNTATTTIRWRRSPSNNAKIQSNARVLRWSDGSLTLQFAHDPLNQYEINAQMLAPQQVNPKVPTPLQAKGRAKEKDQKESYTYLVAPYEEANVMRITNKFTTGLDIVPTANTKDVALEKLQNDLARAATRGRDSADQAISFIDVNEDPELRRQREELVYKEKLKQQRAREKHALREQERTNRHMNKGGQRSGYGGLSAGLLEGEEGGGRGGPRKPRAKPNHWSDDDGYGRGGMKEDEYDEDDDFIAASDEEPEIVEDDDEDEEEFMEEPRRGRETQSPKRNRGGDGDSDDEVVVRKKQRRVIDDEDEDE